MVLKKTNTIRMLSLHLKGGHLDFSHLTELKKIDITAIYMKKQYKSSINKNYKTTKKSFLMVFSLKAT